MEAGLKECTSQDSKADHAAFLSRDLGCHITSPLLCSVVEAVTKIHPVSRGGNLNLSAVWEECQHHIVRRACGMDNIVVAIFENYHPPHLSGLIARKEIRST